jgi:DnaJ-like protein
MADEPDYYSALEVGRDADDEALRLAYRRMAWRYHPDIAGPEGLERMREINAAYQALADPARRKRYDAERGVTRAQPTREAPRSPASRHGLRITAEGPWTCVRRFSGLDQTPVVAASLAMGGEMWAIGQLDGRITVMTSRDATVKQVLRFGETERVGTLQGLRLSPQGAYAVGWGFALGTRVWSVADGRTLWNTSMNAPTGGMDAVVYDNPAYVRLATPDAPIALASDDPFRWAEDGRKATAVYSRPLTGEVSAAWVRPIRCVEDGNLGLLREPPDDNWRTHRRILSLDGRSLLTYSTGQVATMGRANTLRLWDLERRTIRGTPEPRGIGRVSETAGMLQAPIAATPDLRWVAATLLGRQVRLFDLRNRKQRGVEIGAVATDARVALSADGAWLAIARGTRIQVFETERGGQRQEWTAGSEVTSLDFSLAMTPVMLSVGLRSGLVELWSI